LGTTGAREAHTIAQGSSASATGGDARAISQAQLDTARIDRRDRNDRGEIHDVRSMERGETSVDGAGGELLMRRLGQLLAGGRLDHAGELVACASRKASTEGRDSNIVPCAGRMNVAAL
jgi:hypothetical protein